MRKSLCAWYGCVAVLIVVSLLPRLDAEERRPGDIDGATTPSEPASSAGTTSTELFSGWPDPATVLVVTGRQHGYIEPCGCTGLANQKGGLARRHTLLRQIAARGWPVVPLDIGNQVRRYGPQAEIKFRTTQQGLREMGYRVVGFGPEDLRLSVGELIAVAAEDSELFVAANVDLLGFNKKFRIIDSGGIRFGVTSVLGPQHAAKINAPEIAISNDAATSLRDVVPQLATAKCNLRVLLAHATLTESVALARQFPDDFHLIVTAAGAGEPAHVLQGIKGTDALLVQVGTKGMYAGVIGLFPQPDGNVKLKYERVALTDQFDDSQPMLDLLASYQEELRLLGLEGLVPLSTKHPSGQSFVGSEACADCHTTAYAKWQSTPHAEATESIHHPPERHDIARHFDPECLSCHVTGWNPQEFFPYQSGYVDFEKSKHLHGNGCENCHGPGSRHVAVENGDITVSEADRTKLRASMRVAKSADQCMTCHDLDNSPDFHEPGAFEKYWQSIEHIGKD